ncbi:MAG: TonB-dependent receptor, partial [Deltaproteobacteria bacterium]|nr:TonB-dependent receptor [Deltaproteobacteria bacterium]
TKTFDNSTVTMLGETTVLEESERVRDWKIAPVDETSLSRLGVLTNHTFEKLKLSTHLLGLSASRNDLFVLKYPYDKPEDLLYGEGDFRGVLGSVSVSRSFSNADLIISYKPSFGDKEFGFVRVSDIRHSFDMRYVHDFDSTRTTAGVNFDYVIEDSDNSRYFAFLPSDRSFSVKTVFSQIEKEFLDKKGIGIVSIALENNSFTGSNLSGNLRLGYSPTSSSFLWGSVGRAFKLPSRIERDMIYAFRRIPIDDFYSVDGVLLGNNRVKDEQAVGVEGGTRLFVTNNYMIDLSVFRYWYDNLITFSPDSNLVYNDFYQAYVLPFQIENNAEGTAHGVELLNKFQLKELISFDLGYAYFKGSSKLGQKHQSDVLFVEPELRAPEHSVLFRPTLHFGDLVFDFVFRYWNSNKFLWDDPFITVDGGITYSISDTDTIKIVARNLIKTQDFETPSFAGYSMSADLPREFGVYYTRLF